VSALLLDPTGHRPEDLDGKQAHDLLFDAAIWKGRDSDSPMKARWEKRHTRYDAPLLDKSGKVVSIEVISTPLRDAGGAVTGVVDARSPRWRTRRDCGPHPSRPEGEGS
jgi:hypothetical protein